MSFCRYRYDNPHLFCEVLTSSSGKNLATYLANSAVGDFGLKISKDLYLRFWGILLVIKNVNESV